MRSKFVVLSHKRDVECEAGNLQLIKALNHYNFPNYVIEKTSIKCEHDICNKGITIILNEMEYDRLLETVIITEKPRVLTHHSLRELVYMNQKIRENLLQVETSTIAVQATVSMIAQGCQAVPETNNSNCQTDEEKKNDLNYNNIQIQQVPTPPISRPITVSTAPATSVSSSSPDDEEIVFIQSVAATNAPSRPRKRILEKPTSSMPTEPTKEVKEEVQDADDTRSELVASSIPVVEVICQEKEIKQEVAEGSEINDQNEKEFESGSLEDVTTASTDTSSEFVPISDTSYESSTEPDTKRSRRSQSWFSGSICQRCLELVPTDDLDEVYKHVLETHNLINRYTCELCKKQFATHETAKEHMKVHGYDPANGKEVPFPCGKCKTAVRTPETFAVHQMHSKSFILDEITPSYLGKLHEACVLSFPDLFTNSSKAQVSNVVLGLTADAMRSSFPRM